MTCRLPQLEPQAQCNSHNYPTQRSEKECHLHGSRALEVAVRDHVGIGDPTKQDDAIPDDKSGDQTCEEAHIRLFVRGYDWPSIYAATRPRGRLPRRSLGQQHADAPHPLGLLCACGSGQPPPHHREHQEILAASCLPPLRRRHRNGSNECFDRGRGKLRYCNMKCWPMSALGQKQTSGL